MVDVELAVEVAVAIVVKVEVVLQFEIAVLVKFEFEVDVEFAVEVAVLISVKVVVVVVDVLFLHHSITFRKPMDMAKNEGAGRVQRTTSINPCGISEPNPDHGGDDRAQAV